MFNYSREKNDDSSLRFLSKDACIRLMERAAEFAVSGGETQLSVESTWSGNLRWGRNRISTSGDIRNNDIWLTRSVRGARSKVSINQIDDSGIHAAVRRAERFVIMNNEDPPNAPPNLAPETPTSPSIWSDSTYNLEPEARAEISRLVVEPARVAGMLSAGYMQVAAHGRTVLDSSGNVMYYPYTAAQYSVTVRDPKGVGSGWAGLSWHDWNRLNPTNLSEIALDKCLRSRNPVAVEPGRYTAILEPQAVGDLCGSLTGARTLSRPRAEAEDIDGPFSMGQSQSRIGQRMIDARLSISADPMDPNHGFPPFDRYGNVYNKATWFRNGILNDLAYGREYAVKQLGIDASLHSSQALQMSGGDSSIDEMIETTKRGLLVTRFSNVQVIDQNSLLSVGYTRDGLWLIENGKIAKAVKNFQFTESPLFVLNNIEQIGVPQRIFSPAVPIVVPPLKVKDFSFTALIDAI